MAKDKDRKPSRQGWVSKLANAALTALAFLRPLERAISGDLPYFSSTGPGSLVSEATFGLSHGGFNLQTGLQLYGPAIGATSLGLIKSYITRKFPVRR